MKDVLAISSLFTMVPIAYLLIGWQHIVEVERLRKLKPVGTK